MNGRVNTVKTQRTVRGLEPIYKQFRRTRALLFADKGRGLQLEQKK